MGRKPHSYITTPEFQKKKLLDVKSIARVELHSLDRNPRGDSVKKHGDNSRHSDPSIY